MTLILQRLGYPERLLAALSAAAFLGLGGRGLAAEPAAAAPGVTLPPTAVQFADLAHYEAANRELPAPARGEKRVVFLGDSITQAWGDLEPAYFGRSDRINRGFSAMTSWRKRSSICGVVWPLIPRLMRSLRPK